MVSSSKHLAVATLGFPFFTHCTPANVPDDVGFVAMLTLNMDYFRAKLVTIPKITRELEQIYPQMMTKIRFELSTKPSKPKKSGVVPVPAIWMIERLHAWMEQCI